MPVKSKFNQITYRFKDGLIIKRNTRRKGRLAGMWVLRNEHGKLIDFNMYRYDLMEANGLKEEHYE
jgi:hypothetical protein